MSALDLPEERESDLDRDLMKGIAQGDRNAFLRMFDRYAPTAMGLAWRMLRHRHLAEEAVQEAFLAVWRDPDGYRAERGTVRAWLMSTVHHRAVDLIRHEASQNRRAMESAAVISTANGSRRPRPRGGGGDRPGRGPEGGSWSPGGPQSRAAADHRAHVLRGTLADPDRRAAAAAAGNGEIPGATGDATAWGIPGRVGTIWRPGSPSEGYHVIDGFR